MFKDVYWYLLPSQSEDWRWRWKGKEHVIAIGRTRKITAVEPETRFWTLLSWFEFAVGSWQPPALFPKRKYSTQIWMRWTKHQTHWALRWFQKGPVLSVMLSFENQQSPQFPPVVSGHSASAVGRCCHAHETRSHGLLLSQHEGEWSLGTPAGSVQSGAQRLCLLRYLYIYVYMYVYIYI